MKKTLITGITGQDGSYLAEFLLSKGYEVHGIKRKSSSYDSSRIDHIYQDPHYANTHFFMHYGDMTAASNLLAIMAEVRPDEVYKLAAQSHVAVSCETAEYTSNPDGLGTLRLLAAIRAAGLQGQTRFCHVSTSELFGGLPAPAPQPESTPFTPRSSYAAAKLCVVTSALAQTNAPAMNSGSRVGLVQDLMDHGLVVCTAADARDATLRVPSSVGMSRA